MRFIDMTDKQKGEVWKRWNATNKARNMQNADKIKAEIAELNSKLVTMENERECCPAAVGSGIERRQSRLIRELRAEIASLEQSIS